MAVTVNFPTLGILGTAGATTQTIVSNIELEPSTIYVTAPGDSDPYTVTLPTTDINDGAVILIKRLGTGTITIPATLVDGATPGTDITITNNQPIRFVYHSSTIGWLIT